MLSNILALNKQNPKSNEKFRFAQFLLLVNVLIVLLPSSLYLRVIDEKMYTLIYLVFLRDPQGLK